MNDEIHKLETIDKLTVRLKKKLANLYLGRAFFKEKSSEMLDVLDDFKRALALNPQMEKRIPEYLQPLLDARDSNIKLPKLEEKPDISVITNSMNAGKAIKEYNSQVRILNRLMEEQEDNFTSLDNIEEMRHIPSLFELAALKVGTSKLLNVPLHVISKVEEVFDIYQDEMNEDKELQSPRSP